MKRANRFPLIIISIILCLSLIVACQPKTLPQENHVESEANKNNGQEDKIENALEDTEEPPKEIEDIDKGEESSPDTPVSSETDKKTKEEPTATEESDDFLLRIEGAGVENSMALSLDELKAMKEFHFEDDYYSLNSYGTREHFHFKGIKVKALLGKAKLKGTAKKVKFVATDGYSQELSAEEALKEDYIDEDNPEKKFPVIIAWHENGKDYDIKKGAPFRVVVGQLEVDDMNKPKWVSNIAKIIVE